MSQRTNLIVIGLSTLALLWFVVPKPDPIPPEEYAVWSAYVDRGRETDAKYGIGDPASPMFLGTSTFPKELERDEDDLPALLHAKGFDESLFDQLLAINGRSYDLRNGFPGVTPIHLADGEGITVVSRVAFNPVHTTAMFYLYQCGTFIIQMTNQGGLWEVEKVYQWSMC